MIKKHGNEGVAGIENENSAMNYKGLIQNDVIFITIDTFYH